MINKFEVRYNGQRLKSFKTYSSCAKYIISLLDEPYYDWSFHLEEFIIYDLYYGLALQVG